MALLIVSMSLSAQYDRWAFGLESGVHAVGDESATVTDAFNHYGASLRYSFNPMVSLGVSGGYDNISLKSIDGQDIETNYSRISAELYIDAFDLLNLQNNLLTILVHGGPGRSVIRTSNNYADNIFSATGGVDAMFKLRKNISLSLGYRHTANITQDKTLDGVFDVSNSDVNSTLTNLSAGLTIYFDKDKNESHADWYVEPEPEYLIVNNNSYITQELVTNVVESKCDCDIAEFLFFDNDRSDLKEEHKAPLVSVYNYLNDNPEAKLQIIGYASSTNNSDEYNLSLSSRRAVKAYEKLELMGIDTTRIAVLAKGKDETWGDESLHDVARRVELIIKNQ